MYVPLTYISLLECFWWTHTFSCVCVLFGVGGGGNGVALIFADSLCSTMWERFLNSVHFAAINILQIALLIKFCSVTSVVGYRFVDIIFTFLTHFEQSFAFYTMSNGSI